jgi:hypothetical protein
MFYSNPKKTMKTITQKLIKGLLVIVLFTGVSVALSTTGVQTVSEANAAGAGGSAANGPAGQSGVSSSSVYQYLVSRGYTVQSLSQICGSTNWKAYTIGANGVQYITTVYVQSNNFVGHSDGSI